MDLECQICCDSYTTSGLHRPRCLPCGHTLCSSCINRMLVNRVILCPVCKQRYRFENVEKVTINHELEKIIEMLKSAAIAKTKDAPALKVPKLHDGICDEHGIYNVHHCLSHKISICSECVVAYHLEGNCSRIPLEEVLNERKTEICEKIESHISVLQETGRQIELYNNVLRNIEIPIHSSISKTELQIQQLQSSLRVMKQEKSNCQKSHSKYTELFIEFQNWVENAKHSLSSVRSNESFQELKNEGKKMVLTDHKTKEWTKKVEQFLEQTSTYVGYTHEGKQRWGHLMVKNGYLLLQGFMLNSPLPGSITLDLMEVNKMMLSPRHVYMKLRIREIPLGVIVIRVNETAPNRAQQLVDICLGHTGKVYSGHKEITVDNKGDHNEYLDFPFYIDPSNTQNKERDIRSLEKTGKRAYKQGLLVYYGIDSAMFRILTGKGYEGSTVAGPEVGEVVSGMPLLKKIIRENLVPYPYFLGETISKVIISETGLVIE